MATVEPDFDLLSIINYNSKLGDLAAKVAQHNFDYRFATLLFFNASLYYGVDVFLSSFNYNVIVTFGELTPNITRAARQFVLFGSDLDDLRQLLETAKGSQIYNTGKFIVICQSHVSSECNEKAMMEQFWKHQIVNIIFLKEEKSEAIGYTYFPITENNCLNLNPTRLSSSFYRQQVYKTKFKNLYSCPFIISTFKQIPFMYINNSKIAGADGDLIPLIEYAWNATLKLRLPHRGNGWGYRERNGTWMGSLADLCDDLANMSMTSAALTTARYLDFELSNGYYSQSLVWITHPAEFQNLALKLLRPFKSETRVVLVLSFLLVILCAYILKSNICGKMNKHLAVSDQPMKSIVFYAWMICMGQTVTRLPTKTAFLQIAFMWVLYCFLIRTAYQVYLISSLKASYFEDEIQSIEDAIVAKYPFGGGPALKDYYIDNPMVYDNWVSIDTNDIVPTLINLSKGTKFVLAMNLDTALVALKTHKVSVHILPQKIVVSPNAIFFKKYSPLKEPISDILSKLTETGYIDKTKKAYTTIQTTVTSDKVEKLEIIQFTACYAILLIGYFLSAIFFLLELYFGKYHTHPEMSHT